MENNQELEQLEINLPKYKSKLESDGFVCIKNVFSKEEIDEFRRLAYLSVGMNLQGTDLLSNPNLRHVLTDKRIAMIVRELLGDKPIYFGESKVLVDGVNGRNGGSIHKDNPDRLNPDGADWKSEYKVMRFAIYCEDHARHSEGLSVRVGSHKFPSWQKGKLYHIPSEAGDLIGFYFTTTHCGYSRRTRIVKNLTYAWDNLQRPLYTKLLKLIPNQLEIPRERPRIVLFMTFGVKSAILDRYIEYAKQRDYAVRTWKNLKYTDDTFEFLKDKDIELMDMSVEVEKIDMSKVGKHLDINWK
jgi:hypothetical protein